MATITVASMDVLLQGYLEDFGNTLTTATTRAAMMDGAQEYFLEQMADSRQVLHDLDQSLADQSLSVTGSLDLATLTPAPWNLDKGLHMVRLADNEKPADLISYEEYKEMYRQDWSFDTDRPVYMVYGSKIYVLPYSSDAEDLTLVDVWYTKVPTAIAVGATLSFTQTRIRDIIIGLACEAWRDHTPQAGRAHDQALRGIEELKRAYAPTSTTRTGRDLFDRRRGGPSEEPGFPMTVRYIQT